MESSSTSASEPLYRRTGGGQDFVRKYSDKTYNIPTEQAVGTAVGTTFGYDKTGRPFLTKDPKLLLNDNNAGKPEGIQLMIGRRPYAATRWHGTYELFEQRHTLSGEWGGKAADQGELST